MSWTVRGWAVVCVLALLHIAAVRAVRLSARDAPPQANNNNNNNNNGPSSSSSSGEGSGSAELSESSRRASESSRSEESTVSQFLTESGQPDPKKLFGEFVPTPESSEGSRAQRTNSSANSNRSGSGSRNRTGESAEHGSEASRVSESSKVELSAEEVASIQRQSERSAAEYSEELKHEFSESARIIRSWSSTAPRSASLSGESNPFSSLGSLESSAEASWSSLASNSASGLSGASDSLSDLKSVSLSSQDRRKDSSSSDASSSFSSSSSSGSLSHSGPSESKKGGAFTDDEASIQRRIDAALKPEPGDVKMAKFLTKLVDPSAPPKPAIVQYNRNYIKQIDVTKQNPTRDVMEEAHKKQLALGAEVHEEETHKMNLKDVAHARKVTAKQLARSKQSLKWQRDFTVKARAARKQAIKESEMDAALLHKEAKEEAEKQRAQLQRIASENKAFHAKLKHEQQLFLQRQESSAKQQAIEKQKQLEADARRADEERKKDQEATVQGRNAAFAKTQRLESEVKAARVKAHQDNRAQEARAKRQTGALVAQQRRTDIDKIQRTSEAEAQATRDRITKDADQWAESKQKKANEMQQKQQAEASVKKQTQTEETSKRTNEQNYKHHYNNEQQSKSDWLKRITDDRRQWYRRYYGR